MGSKGWIQRGSPVEICGSSCLRCHVQSDAICCWVADSTVKGFWSEIGIDWLATFLDLAGHVVEIWSLFFQLTIGCIFPVMWTFLATEDDGLHEKGEKATGREKSSSDGPSSGRPKFRRADADRIGPCQRHGGFLHVGLLRILVLVTKPSMNWNMHTTTSCISFPLGSAKSGHLRRKTIQEALFKINLCSRTV